MAKLMLVNTRTLNLQFQKTYPNEMHKFNDDNSDVTVKARLTILILNRKRQTFIIEIHLETIDSRRIKRIR